MLKDKFIYMYIYKYLFISKISTIEHFSSNNNCYSAGFILYLSCILNICIRQSDGVYTTFLENTRWIFFIKQLALSEDRTHDLQIMRLTRCLLRYQGLFTCLICSQLIN